MGNKCCGHNGHHQSSEEKVYNILLLGMSGSGKTEIGCKLTHTTRTDYSRTNGVRVFKRTVGDKILNITEIGGSEQMRKIWRHYYVKAMGLIYAVDVSAPYPEVKMSLNVLKEIMHHKYMAGKPVVFVATKTDEILEDLSIFELNEILGLEQLANECRTFMQLETITLGDFKMLFTSLNWMIVQIRENYHAISNRIEFDKMDAKENRFPVAPHKERSLIRSARIAMHTMGDRVHNRPHSAPAAAFHRSERVGPATTKKVRFEVGVFDECLAPEIDIEEITLHKSRSDEKLGFTVSYSSGNGSASNSASEDDDEDTCADIYISDILPDSLAARDGRLRQGDQILQINGRDVSNKDEIRTQ